MNVVVVKIGGHALDTLSVDSTVLADLASDVAALRVAGANVVIVHGGGPQIAQLLSEVQISSEFHDGLRVTDSLTMDYVAMALALVNVRMTAALNQQGLRAAGLSGADANLFTAAPLDGPWLRVGSQPSVSPDLVRVLWERDVTPIVSSVAVDAKGELLNINADTAAGALAGALEADVLVLLSDIDQIRSEPDNPESGLTQVTGDELRVLLDSGAARDGMRPKVIAALDALAGGAQRILLANGTRRHALAQALLGAIPTTEVQA